MNSVTVNFIPGIPTYLLIINLVTKTVIKVVIVVLPVLLQVNFQSKNIKKLLINNHIKSKVQIYQF